MEEAYCFKRISQCEELKLAMEDNLEYTGKQKVPVIKAQFKWKLLVWHKETYDLKVTTI